MDIPSKIKEVSVGYFTNSGGKDDCGLKAILGYSRFSCKSHHHANISRFNDVKFSKTIDSTSDMCLEIRSGTDVFQCFFFFFFFFFIYK